MLKEYNRDNIPIAKVLRKNMTRHEKKLWYDFLCKYPQRIKDSVRTAELEGMNLRVLRFRNSDIDKGLDMVCRRIDNVVKEALTQEALHTNDKTNA